MTIEAAKNFINKSIQEVHFLTDKIVLQRTIFQYRKYIFWRTKLYYKEKFYHIKIHILCYEIGLFQKKIQTGVTGIFKCVLLPLEILEKTSFHPWKFWKIMWHPLKIPRSKTKTLDIPHGFFLNTSGISTIILFLPWPWTFRVLNSLLCSFSEIAYLK